MGVGFWDVVTPLTGALAARALGLDKKKSAAVGGAVAVAQRSGKQTVPYTCRKHFIPIPDWVEDLIGQSFIESYLQTPGIKILPGDHRV